MPLKQKNLKTGKIPFADSEISEALFDHIVNASVDSLLRKGIVNDRKQAFSYVLGILYKLGDQDYFKKFSRLYGLISKSDLTKSGEHIFTVFSHMKSQMIIYNRFLCKTDKYLKLD